MCFLARVVEFFFCREVVNTAIITIVHTYLQNSVKVLIIVILGLGVDNFYALNHYILLEDIFYFLRASFSY